MLYNVGALPGVLPLQNEEILRYLGVARKADDPATQALLDKAVVLLQQNCQIRFVYREFALDAADEGGLPLQGAAFSLQGGEIATLLKGCHSCVLMAATLGMGLDRLISRVQLEDMALAVCLDAAATTQIEAACDLVQAEIETALNTRGQAGTWRFSPGYGDMPLACQGQFLQVLDTPRKIGLNSATGGLMTPLKSVTAVLGIKAQGEVAAPKKKSCESCNLKESCVFRQRGTFCGK